MRLSNLYKLPISLPVTQAGLDLGTWNPNSSVDEGVNFGENSKLLIPGVTTTERLLSTPLEREILYDETEDKVYYGDGITVGSGGGDAISLVVASAVG